MPCSGTIPCATSSAACDSGIPSASELTTAAAAPDNRCASTKASTVVRHGAVSQRSSRGRSSTSRWQSNRASSSAAKVSVNASRSPQM